MMAKYAINYSFSYDVYNTIRSCFAAKKMSDTFTNAHEGTHQVKKLQASKFDTTELRCVHNLSSNSHEFVGLLQITMFLKEGDGLLIRSFVGINMESWDSHKSTITTFC